MKQVPVSLKVPTNIHYEIRRLTDLDNMINESEKKLIKDKYIEVIAVGLAHINKLKVKQTN